MIYLTCFAFGTFLYYIGHPINTPEFWIGAALFCVAYYIGRNEE